MKVVDLLTSRRDGWSELARLCTDLESLGSRRRMTPKKLLRFGALYRAACADLALADAYQLPPATIKYLHQLVARAHNQLYRRDEKHGASWWQKLFVDIPANILHDRCIQAAFVLFWGLFILTAVLAAKPEIWPEFAELVVGEAGLESMRQMYSQPIHANEQHGIDRTGMAGFYVKNNAGIGLQCFAGGLLILPGLYITVFNASFLGSCFGYMARPDVPEGVNFYHFVIAHGPFELTAIVLAAGAGLRLGVSLLITGGLTRGDSLRNAGQRMAPAIGLATLLFVLAAMIEGFISPSKLPYEVKLLVAMVTSLLLIGYFGVLGAMGSSRHAAR